MDDGPNLERVRFPRANDPDVVKWVMLANIFDKWSSYSCPDVFPFFISIPHRE